MHIPRSDYRKEISMIYYAVDYYLPHGVHCALYLESSLVSLIVVVTCVMVSPPVDSICDAQGMAFSPLHSASSLKFL